MAQYGVSCPQRAENVAEAGGRKKHGSVFQLTRLIKQLFHVMPYYININEGDLDTLAICARKQLQCCYCSQTATPAQTSVQGALSNQIAAHLETASQSQ